MASPSAHVYIDVPQPVGQHAIPPTRYPANLHFQTTTTTDHTSAPQPDNRDTGAERGENHEDPSDGLWSMYLTLSEKAGKEVIENWKGDAEGILVFTGLFSATVAAFIIEGYKNLSPDSSNTTNALLTQISGQLANISNGTPLTSVTGQSIGSHPFNPTASAIRVNVLWFLSLVLSLNCALSATLMQQWARRYQELTQRRNAIHRRGRMQAYISDGMSRFKILAQAVVPISTLLHISVFLFFAGLVEFLFPIYTTVAYTTLVCIGMSAFPYAILTILPSVYFNCPYGTPMSGFIWRISQAAVLEIFKAIRYIEIHFQFHGPFSILWNRTGRRRVTGPPSPIQWEKALDNQIAKYNEWLLHGQRKSAELSAYTAEARVVTRSLEWTLTVLDEDKEIEHFAARVPGFFDSRVIPDVISVVLPLMSHEPKKVPVFGSRLHHLLETCGPTSLLDEKMRKIRIRVCLTCLWYFGRAYNQTGVSQPLPPYFRNFLIPEITRVQAGEDASVDVIRRCLVALIVNKLTADLRSRNNPISNGELEYLSTVLGTEGRDLKLLLSQPGAVTLVNMISLVFGEVGTLATDTVPSNMLDMVQQTLGILLQALLAQENTEAQLDQPIAIIAGSDGKFEHILISRLLDLLKMCVTMTSPFTEELRTSCLRLCLKGLWYFGQAFNRLGDSAPLPTHIWIAFTPEVIHGIRNQRDFAVRELGRCVGALVINKLVADIKSRTVPVASRLELAHLSAILGTDKHDVGLLLSQPGFVALANMISLMLDEVGTLATDPVPSDVPDMVQQTLVILSQALPAQENTELHFGQPISIIGGSDGKFEHILVSRLHDLLNMCIDANSPLTEGARTCCLRMCLKGLWCLGRALNELGNSVALPPYISIAFSNLEMAGQIREQRDLSVRVIGNCVRTLIVNKLAADFHSRIIPVSNSDAELAWLSAILGTNIQDVTLLLSYPGAIEIMNVVPLVFDDIDYTYFRGPTSNVLDVVRQTIGILSHALQVQPNTKIRLDLTDTQNVIDTSGTPSLTFKSVLRMCLKNLWNFTRAYNEPGNLVPLPLHVCIAFTYPEMIPRIRKGGDVAAHVIRRCIGALVVNKIATDINARTTPVNDTELACLSALLGTNNQDLTLLLSHPGAIQLANMIFLLLDDIYDSPSWSLTSDVLDIVRQTFSILSQALPAQLDAEKQLDLTDTLMDVSRGTSSLIHLTGISILGMYLKNLWHFTRVNIERGNSIIFPSYIYIAFTCPEIARRIRKKGDVAAHVIRRCVVALFVNKLVASINTRTPTVNDAELACLSAVLGTNSRDVKLLLSHPGAIQLADMIFLALDDIYGSPSWSSTPDVLDVVRQSFWIISQALPAQLDAEMRLDLTDTLTNVSRGALSLTQVMGIRVLGMCLKNMWHFTRVYIERGNSIPLPSYIYVAFTHPELTRRIRKEGDVAAQVIRRCVGALVVSKLAADINARIVAAEDAELACLSSILDSERRDVRLCLTQPGIVEVVNMASFALGHVGSLKVSDVPPDPRNVLQQTLAVLSRALPDQENAEQGPDQMVTLSNISGDRFERTIVTRLHGFLRICRPGASLFMEDVRMSCLRMCLKTLWHSGKAYHHNSDPLPPYFHLTLASPEITHQIQTEQDPVARLTGYCFGALIVSKLVDSLKPPISLSGHVENAELACISAILGTGHREDLLSPHQLRVINLRNVVSLMSSEIDILFTTEGMATDVLGIGQDTLYVLATRLRDRRFVLEDVLMDQRGTLLDIHGEVQHMVRSDSDRLKDQTLETLDRLRQMLEKLLPAVDSSQDIAMQD